MTVKAVQRIFNAATMAVTLLVVDPSYALQVGVGTHMGQGRQTPETVRKALSYLGTIGIRDEVYWDKVELSPGDLTSARVPRQLNGFLQTAQGDERSSLLVLDYGNPLYENGARPSLPHSRFAYGRYARFVAEKYGNSIAYLEIWNEWNLATGYKNGVRGTASDYAALVKDTTHQLRASGFKGKILIGGLGGDRPDWAFTKSLLKDDVLRHADGYSVHLYNFARGGQWSEMISRLIRLQQLLSAANNGHQYPVYVTEVGWPTHEGKFGSSEAEAAIQISTFLFEAAALPWLHGVWLYELFDGGTDLKNEEQNFGMLHYDGRPKAGTCVIRGAINIVQHSSYRGAGQLTPSIRWLQFESNGNTYIVLYKNDLGTPMDAATKNRLKSAENLCNLPGNDGMFHPVTDQLAEAGMPVFLRVAGTGINVPALLKQSR